MRHRARCFAALTVAPLLTIALAAQQDQASSLARDIAGILSAPSLAHALVSVDVRAADSGRVVFQQHADARMVPASVLKLITAATAGAQLGWDYRFTTTLSTDGTIRDGVLDGNLFVTGTGDPSIAAQDLQGSAQFDAWAEALRGAGITRITGSLIGDDSAFDDDPLGGGWAWDNLSAGYAAPSGALNYNDNVVVVRVTPALEPGSPPHIQVGPPGHGLAIEADVRTGPPDAAPVLIVTRPLGSDRLAVTGQLPAGAGTVIRTASVANPTRFFLEALRHQLTVRGIAIAGSTRLIGTAPVQATERKTLATRQSEPLSLLIGSTLKASQNMYAETLLKALGRSSGAAPGSTARGIAAVRATLSDWNLPVETLVMRDGSGLSRYDYVSSALVSSLLVHVWNDARLRGPFVAALPTGGYDGTLSGRMRNSTLERRVQAKTGTLDNVRSLAGYVHTEQGETLVFSLIANHFVAPASEIDQVMEQVLIRLVQ